MNSYRFVLEYVDEENGVEGLLVSNAFESLGVPWDAARSFNAGHPFMSILRLEKRKTVNDEWETV